MSNKLPGSTLGRLGPFFGGQQYSTRSLSWISPFRNDARTSAVNKTHFPRPLLALIASRTLISSRHAVGESRRTCNTSRSAYPGTTIRADAFVSIRFSAVHFPSFLSTSTNRDCRTQSCRPCFFQVHQMTLASAGGITVAAAFSCHARHRLETASKSCGHEKRIVQQLRHVDACLLDTRFHSSL